MNQPVPTPNPATSSRPARSSQRVARKKPLGWLPWLLLLALIVLAALIWWGISEAVETSPTTRTAAPATSSAEPSPAATASAGPSAAASGGPVTGAAPGSAGLLAGALIGGGAVATTGIGSASTAVGTAAGKQAPGTAGTVLFAEASPVITANGQKVIVNAARNLKISGAKSVSVRGYTDVVSGPKVNTPLSRQRADNVAKALGALLPGVTVTPIGKDQADPVAANSTPAGRQQNRRAVIVATG